MFVPLMLRCRSEGFRGDVGDLKMRESGRRKERSIKLTPADPQNCHVLKECCGTLTTIDSLTLVDTCQWAALIGLTISAQSDVQTTA